jgi:hypothetical protein
MTPIRIGCPDSLPRIQIVRESKQFSIQWRCSCTGSVQVLSTHQGLKCWSNAHGNSGNDFFYVTQLPQQSEQPEGTQNPHLHDVGVAVRFQQDHRPNNNDGVEEGPSVCTDNSAASIARCSSKHAP